MVTSLSSVDLYALVAKERVIKIGSLERFLGINLE